MGSIGAPEILVILVVALIVLGPTRLPDAARSVGRAMNEFRRMTNGFQAEIRDALEEPRVIPAEPQPPEPPPFDAGSVAPPPPPTVLLPPPDPTPPPPTPPEQPAAAEPTRDDGPGTHATGG